MKEKVKRVRCLVRGGVLRTVSVTLAVSVSVVIGGAVARVGVLVGVGRVFPALFPAPDRFLAAAAQSLVLEVP